MHCFDNKTIFFLHIALLLTVLSGRAQVIGEDASAFQSDANYSYSALPQVTVDNGLQLRVWNVEDGLAESNIFMSYSDVDFNLYLSHGPVYGFSWLDGYGVKKIESPKRLALHTQGSLDRIWTIWKDSLQAPVQGLLQYGKETKRWKKFLYPENAVSLKGGILNYVPVSEDRIFILFRNRLLELAVESEQISILKTTDQSGIGPFIFLMKAKDGGAWILGEKGIAKLSLSGANAPNIWEWNESLYEWPVKQIQLHTPIEKREGEFVFSAELDSGNLLIQYDGKSLTPLYRSEEPLRFGWREDEESVWFCRGQAGESSLVNIKNGVEIVHPVSLTGVGYVQVNEENSIFIPRINGLYCYSYYSWRKPDYALNPQHKDIFPGTILQDEKGAMWLSDLEWLHRVERDRLESYSKPEGFRDSFYYTQNLLSQPDGSMWIGGNFNEYILFFDPRTGQFEKIAHPENRRIGFLFPRRVGGAWAITGERGNFRLEIFDGKSFQTYLDYGDQWKLEELRYLYEEENGDLWFGGMSDECVGLYRNGEYKTFGKEYPGNAAACILRVDANRLWFTDRSGLIEYDGHEFRTLRPDLDQVLSMIKAKDGSVWLASFRGVHRYYQNSWVTYTEEDGLPDNACVEVYEDNRNRIWVSTLKGVSIFHPETDKDPPRIFFKENENVHTVSPDGEVRFVFSGIDKWKYTESDRLLYSYRLNGGDWSPFQNQNVISFDRLAAGPHRLEARAMDRNWNIDPKPVAWEFQVARHWYEEPKVLWILLIGTLVLLVAIGYAVNRHIHLEHAYIHVQQANEKLLELDKMKSAFVSQASHDLRTPLTAIKGSLDNLLLGIAGEINDKQKKVIERATHSVDRLTGLVNDVLDLSRIESGRMVLEKSPVSMSALVEAVIQECRPAAEQKRIVLSYAAPSESLSQLLDAGKIQRVIGELISNAIKYTPEGGRVNLSLAQDNGTVSLSVQDTGIGMTPEESQKIWERFYRTPVSQKMAKGTGLGLSIAKELVEMHGGRLDVKSEVGKGTVFVLSLPLSN